MYAGIVLLWIWECGNKARELRRRLVNQEMVNAYYDGVRSYDMLVKRTSAFNFVFWVLECRVLGRLPYF